MPTSSSANMAATTKKKADQAKSFVRPGTKKQVSNKTRDLSSNKKSPVTIINVGKSNCAKCDNVDKVNMVMCILCNRWYHGMCESLKNSNVKFFEDNPESPYLCKYCCEFLNSHLGQILKLKDSNDELKRKVSQAEKKISLQESRLKAVEQQNLSYQRLEFQEAVNKQIEKHIENIKKDFKEMEDKFENVPVDVRADARSYQCRKKRIVIFGMPNTNNDLETVQLLSEELEFGRLNIKKIFRINSNTCDNSIAPPLNIEFISMDDKWKFLNKITREKIKNIPSSSLFCGVSVAPDRSYQERQKYRQLRDEMNQRNTQIKNNGSVKEVWIIRKMSLEKVGVKQNED